MRLELHSSRIAISDSTQAYVERRLGFALGRFSDVVESVVVSLADINGPRGGIDKSCRIRVKLMGQKTPVIADVLELEIRAAIDMAAERVGRAVARQLDRRTPRRSSDKQIETLQTAD
jgi:putative sigma-54 modulation protein